MRAVLSWLRDYAPFDQPVEVLADALSNLGLVVDGVQSFGGELPGVIVAKVLETRPHPDADRVQLVNVDVGDGEATQIVCGAFNMRAGDLVPLATIGTTMPSGMEIARRKVRGQWSNGMLCSASELQLPDPDDSSDPGILILPAGGAEPGTTLADALELRPDAVFDLDVTPNRPDALCMVGVARDLAAALHVPFDGTPVGRGLDAPGVGGSVFDVDVSVEAAVVDVRAPEACSRFTATVLDGVSVGPSPAWLARRLILAGMRPISNVVDVSNYVMLDVGHPNHAYDLDRLAGRGLQVRWAAAGEELVTLDGVTRRLVPDDCVIADAEGHGVGIGGIMGAASAEISPSTTTVLLEIAWFAPERIARTGGRLGLHTEARVRFERGCDTEGFKESVDRFVELLGGVRRGETNDVRFDAHLPGPRTIPVRTARVNALLGSSLSGAQVRELLGPIGFGVEGEPSESVFAAHGAAAPGPVQSGSVPSVSVRSEQVLFEQVQSVSVPSWRPDVEREIDVIEEIARLYGYRRIVRSLPSGPRQGAGLAPYQRERRLVADILAGAGLTEVWTTTFLAAEDHRRAGSSAQPVVVANPLDRGESTLRASLLPGLLRVVRSNQDRQSADLALFEVGSVFASPDDAGPLPTEREVLGAVFAGGDADARTAAAVWTVLGEALGLREVELRNVSSGLVGAPGFHPTRQAAVVGEAGKALGTVGEVDPGVAAAFGADGRVGYFEVDLGLLLAEPRRSGIARPVSRFPASDMDLAFLVDETVAAGDVRRTLAASTGELGESVGLFDVYRDERLPAGQRSLAFRLRLRALDRTLTDEEVAAVRQAAVDAAATAHAATLRV